MRKGLLLALLAGLLNVYGQDSRMGLAGTVTSVQGPPPSPPLIEGSRVTWDLSWRTPGWWEHPTPTFQQTPGGMLITANIFVTSTTRGFGEASISPFGWTTVEHRQSPSGTIFTLSSEERGLSITLRSSNPTLGVGDSFLSHMYYGSPWDSPWDLGGTFSQRIGQGTHAVGNLSYALLTVPEPATGALLAFGLLCLGAAARRTMP